MDRTRKIQDTNVEEEGKKLQSNCVGVYDVSCVDQLGQIAVNKCFQSILDDIPIFVVGSWLHSNQQSLFEWLWWYFFILAKFISFGCKKRIHYPFCDMIDIFHESVVLVHCDEDRREVGCLSIRRVEEAF